MLSAPGVNIANSPDLMDEERLGLLLVRRASVQNVGSSDAVAEEPKIGGGTSADGSVLTFGPGAITTTGRDRLSIHVLRRPECLASSPSTTVDLTTSDGEHFALPPDSSSAGSLPAAVSSVSSASRLLSRFRFP